MLEIQDLLIGMHFEKKEVRQIINYLDTHFEKMQERGMVAYMNDAPEYCIMHFHPFIRLCTIAILLPFIKQLYQSFAVAETIILSTLQDVTLRKNLYLQKITI